MRIDDPTLDEVSARAEIAQTHALLEEIIGRPPDLIRPPFGRAPERVDRIAADFGYRATVNFLHFHNDWDQPPARTIADSVHESVTRRLDRAAPRRLRSRAGGRIATRDG